MELMSSSIDELAKALCKAQSEIRGAKKDADNPFFKSKYADLESVWDACRPALNANGLSVTQVVSGTQLVTMLLHTSGQWVRGAQEVCPKESSPQAIGSAITYARRYGLAAIVGVVQVDDDAEQGMGRGEKPGAEKNNVTTLPPGDKARPFPVKTPPADPGDYVMPLGKYKGSTLAEMGAHGVDTWAKSIYGMLDEKGEKPSGRLAEALDAAEAFLKSREFDRAK